MNEDFNSLSRREVQAELELLRTKIERLEKHAARPEVRRGPWRRLLFCGVMLAAAALLALGVMAADGKDALFINDKGNVGINQTNPEKTLDVNGDAVVRGQLQARGAIPASPLLPANSGVVIGDSDIYFTSATHNHTHQGDQKDFAAIENASDFKALMILGRRTGGQYGEDRVVGIWDKLGIKTGDPKATLDVAGNAKIRGSLEAANIASTNPMRNRMYPQDALVYQDIFAARDARVIAKLGNPSPYDDTTYRTNLWGDRKIILFGQNVQRDDNGAQVNVPAGYDTLWIRVLGDRWTTMHVYFLDGNRENLGNWTGGWREANSYAPDGGLSDSYAREHQWVPIPVGRSGPIAIISSHSDSQLWISGVAFSKNPWGHAAQSAVGYHWAVNGGNPTFWGQDWHIIEADSLSQIGPKTNLELKVPVVANGHDKLLYMVERNQGDTRSAHTGITVEGTPIERLLDTYDNPFARHWNSKIFNRYLAARIPANLIPKGARFISVRFDMSKQNGNGLRFREIGTHDLETPF